MFQLFCCPRYERLVKFELAQREDSGHLVDEMIDIKPHPPYGTKAARRAAKERAAARAREREMERQRAAGANPLNFYACKYGYIFAVGNSPSNVIIKEIKHAPSALLSYISMWEFLRTLAKCEKHSPSGRASPHFSRVLKNSCVLI